MDQSAALLREAEKSFNGSFKANWYHRDISKGIQLENTRFDFICLWNNLYNFIPTKKRRVQLLKDCRAHLKPDGICSLSFFILPSPISLIEQWANIWRKGFAWIVGGNPDCELGDMWQGGHFLHQFSSVEEAIEESHLAGFDLLWTNTEGQKMLVLKSLKEGI